MCIRDSVKIVNNSHSCQLHLSKISDSSSLSDILARRGLNNSPLCKNTRSTGAELAGVHRIYSNSSNRKAYSGVWATAETDVADKETAGELIHTTCIHNNNRGSTSGFELTIVDLPHCNLPQQTYPYNYLTCFLGAGVTICISKFN